MKDEKNWTLAEQAAEALRELIKEKNLTAGDKLPTEMELAEILGVGRNTVREALRMVASRNIITIRHGAGSFVSEKYGVADDPLGFYWMEDGYQLTKDLLQLRIILEPPLAALAAQNASEEEVARLEQILVVLETLMERREDYTEKDMEFHVQIANCCHNGVVANLFPVISKGVLVFAGEVGETEYQQTLVSHRRIFEAIKERKPMEAEQAMQFHLLYNTNRYMEEHGFE